jgi:hypothetical protein
MFSHAHQYRRWIISQKPANGADNIAGSGVSTIRKLSAADPVIEENGSATNVRNEPAAPRRDDGNIIVSRVSVITDGSENETPIKPTSDPLARTVPDRLDGMDVSVTSYI